eukprot:1160656-Pelagomonas_calceolata.AAC.5
MSPQIRIAACNKSFQAPVLATGSMHKVGSIGPPPLVVSSPLSSLTRKQQQLTWPWCKQSCRLFVKALVDLMDGHEQAQAFDLNPEFMERMKAEALAAAGPQT